jgi:hypothetical protein
MLAVAMSFGKRYGLLGSFLFGLAVGPLFYGQPFIAALAGQIPFTLMHLLGTVLFSVVVSPLVYRWIVRNERLELTLFARPAGAAS